MNGQAGTMGETRDFRDGVLFGLVTYSRSAARVGTFDAPNIMGTLAGATGKSDYTRGVLHGFALGAELQVNCMLDTVALRDAETAQEAS